MDYVLGTINMHIKRCFTAIEKYHLLGYQGINFFKYVKKRIINDHPEKNNY